MYVLMHISTTVASMTQSIAIAPDIGLLLQPFLLLLLLLVLLLLLLLLLLPCSYDRMVGGMELKVP